MISLNCLLVEDDNNFITYFLNQITNLPFLKVVKICKSYAETLSALRAHPNVDFILLDIFLESPDGLNGFDILRHNNNLPPVIIISNAPENAIESYNIGKAKDFLIKPFDNDRLLLAINRAMERTIENKLFIDNNSIFFKMGRQYQKFNLEEIDYFEGYGIYTKVILNERTEIINETLTHLEKALDDKQFMRVHKSFIINLSKLEGFDANNLYLKNGSVPIGISYKPNLAVLLKLFGNHLD